MRTSPRRISPEKQWFIWAREVYKRRYVRLDARSEGAPPVSPGQAKVRRYGSGLGVLNLKAVSSAIFEDLVSRTTEVDRAAHPQYPRTAATNARNCSNRFRQESMCVS